MSNVATLFDYVTMRNNIDFVGKGIHKNEDVPMFIWDKELLEDKEYFEKFVIMLMDQCLWNNAIPGELNPLENYEIKNGKISFSKIRDVTRPHNVIGAAFEKGHDLLQTPINGLVNENRKQPIKFSIVRTDDEALREKIEKASEILTDAIKKNAISQISNQFNIDLEQVADINTTGNPEEAKNILESLSENELEISRRINTVLDTTKTKENLDDCIEDRFVVNMEVGKVSIRKGEVEFLRIPIQNFAYIGGDDKTLEYAMAASHWEYVSISQMVSDDSFNIKNFKTKQSLLSKLKELATNDLGNQASTISYEELITGDDYNNYFQFGTSSYDTKVLKQDIDFRIIRLLKFKVLYKGRDIKEDKFKEYEKYGASWDELDYIDLVPSEESEDGKFYTWKPITETYTARRYGQELLYVRKDNLTVRSLSNFNLSPLSYVMRRSEVPSLVTIAAPLNEMYQIAMFKIRESSVRSGGKALKAYSAMIPDNYANAAEAKYAASTVGIIEMEMNLESGVGKTPGDHMTTVDLDESQSIMKWLDIAIRVKMMLESTLGISPERLGASTSPTATQASLSFRSSFVLTAHNFYEHDLFVADAIRSVVNVGRKLWSSNRYANRLSKNQGKILNKLKDTGLEEYGLTINSSSKDAEQLSLIRQLTEKWMDRVSDMDAMEAALSIMTNDNAEDALKSFQKIKTQYNKLVEEQRAQELKAAGDIARQNAEIEKQSRIDIPLEAIRSKERIAAAKNQIMNSKHEGDLLFKQDKEDINRQNQLQDKQLDTLNK